jgi:ankyrin repeat protein
MGGAMLLPGLITLVLSFAATFAEDPSERFYQSIRNNDLGTLRTLIKEHGVRTKDAYGQTALMIAVGFGSVDAMKILIDGGADVNETSQAGVTALHWCAGEIKKVRLLLEHGADVHARSQMGRTPLLVAAYTNGASETVKLLLSKGADVNAADTFGTTPLIAAANVNDAASVKLLIAHGAKVDAHANVGAAATALMGAAHNGNLELVRILLGRNAPVNASSRMVGVVQLGSATALHFAALSGNTDVVKALLDAAARVDLQDVRGMPPVMWSVSTDRPSLPIVRMLMAKGSDVSVRSKVTESTIDWARKFNHPDVLGELKTAYVKKYTPLPSAKGATTAREAVERSLPLLQTSSANIERGCIACHAQPVTAMAAKLARDRGWKVDETAASELLQTIRTRWMTNDQGLLQALEAGGSPDTLLYSSTALAVTKEPANWKTDVLVHYLIAKQRPEGNWHGVGATRAPIQDGDFSRTAMSVLALATYGMPARKTEIDERIKRAAGWLSAKTPLSTEDCVMQLLGLKWANANTRLRETRTRELIAQQRSDGGWAQTPYLASDAYATGQVLYTLHELGIPSSDPAFRRGAQYLLQTQAEDGSWYVKSRAMKIQPYFESGFPYEHDQWISSAATAWAAMALSLP